MKHKSEYKILIVDDIAENIKVAANFLRKYGYNISFAMDGGQALKKVGIAARQDLEKFFNKQIHLETFVKVAEDWRKKGRQIKNFGY